MAETTLRVAQRFTIDESELVERFVRASGPGGQNVNKVSSAVELRFDLAACPTLPAWLKERAARLAGRRLTQEGVIVIEAQRFRTQERNREDAKARLLDLLEEAAAPPAKRVPTKVSRAAKARRVDEKTRRGQVKAGRGRVGESD